MSILSVDNISPIGSGTSVTINSAATLVLNNANSTGVVTATSFVGNLTGTASGNAVLSGSTNNTLVTVTGANAITGESNLTFDGATLTAHMSAAEPAVIVGDSNRTGAGQHLAEFRGYWDGNHVARLVFRAGDDTTNKDDGIITMHTTPSGGGITERLRIDSNGYLSFAGDTDTYIHHPSANQLAITRAGGSAPLMRWGTGGNGVTVGINTDGNLVTNSEILSVRGYSSFKSLNDGYAAIYTHNEEQGNSTIASHILFNVGGANRGGFGYDTDNSTLIMGNQNSISFKTGATQLGGTERARIQSGGLKLNGGSYIVECSEGGGGTTNNNIKQMDQRRWMWYGSSSSTHTVARVAKASSGSAGDGDSSLAAWIVTYTARSMYGFNSDGGYSVMKMRTGRFDYNDNKVRFSTEQDTLGTGGGSQNPTIVFTDEGSGVVRISITNPSSTHSFGEINLMTYDCRITLPSG